MEDEMLLVAFMSVIERTKDDFGGGFGLKAGPMGFP